MSAGDVYGICIDQLYRMYTAVTSISQNHQNACTNILVFCKSSKQHDLNKSDLQCINKATYIAISKSIQGCSGVSDSVHVW